MTRLGGLNPTLRCCATFSHCTACQNTGKSWHCSLKSDAWKTSLSFSDKTRWWQLKYFFIFHPYLGKMNTFWLIFFNWVVQPPTSKFSGVKPWNWTSVWIRSVFFVETEFFPQPWSWGCLDTSIQNVYVHLKINGWNLKIIQLKRKIIFQTSILGSHVNFAGCIRWNNLGAIARHDPNWRWMHTLLCHFSIVKAPLLLSKSVKLYSL